jgi:hypothetical protein
MRNQVFVQEHHLLEAVRREVITERQMQDVLSIARSMGPASNTPDLSWLTIVQSVVVGGIAFVPAMMALMHMHRGHAAETLVYSVVAVVGLLMVAMFMRRNGLGKMPTGIAAVGAAMWCWGLGAGIVGTVVFPKVFRDTWDYSYSIVASGVEFNFWKHSLEAHKQLTYLAGDVAMLVGAIAVGVIGKIPATASAGAVAVLASIMHAAELYERYHGNLVTDRKTSVILVFASAVLLIIGFVMQRMTRTSRFDPAFWVHTVGILSLGMAGFIMIDHDAGMALPWLAAAVAVIAAGVKLDRKSFIVGGCAALLFYVPFGAAKARAGDAAVGVASTVAAIAVAVVILIVRRVYVARAAQGRNEIEQGVWG